MDIVPSFANEDRAIVFYARHGEGLRPLKVLLEGCGPPLVNQECVKTRH